MKEAYGYGISALDRGLQDSAEWVAGSFGDGVDVLRDAVAAVRATHERGKTKLKDLDVIPKLFGRLREHGVKDRIVVQWGEVPPEMHDNISRFVMIRLRADFDMVTPWGTRISERLAGVVNAIGRLSLDDSIAESPHAFAANIF